MFSFGYLPNPIVPNNISETHSLQEMSVFGLVRCLPAKPKVTSFSEARASTFHCCFVLCSIHHWYLVHAYLAKTELFLNHVKLKLNRNTTPSPTTSCTLDRLVPLKSHWFLQIHLKNNDREAPVRGKNQLLVTQPLVTKFTKPVPNRHPSTAGPGMGAKPHLWILMKMKVSDGSDTTNLGFQNLEVLQRNGLKASWTMLFFIFWYIWWFFKSKRHKNHKKQRKAWFNFGMPT